MLGTVRFRTIKSHRPQVSTRGGSRPAEHGGTQPIGAPADIEIARVILALGPDGAGVLRSNAGEEELCDMAELLAEIADGAAFQPADSEPLN